MFVVICHCLCSVAALVSWQTLTVTHTLVPTWWCVVWRLQWLLPNHSHTVWNYVFYVSKYYELLDTLLLLLKKRKPTAVQVGPLINPKTIVCTCSCFARAWVALLSPDLAPRLRPLPLLGRHELACCQPVLVCHQQHLLPRVCVRNSTPHTANALGPASPLPWLTLLTVRHCLSWMLQVRLLCHVDCKGEGALEASYHHHPSDAVLD